MASMHRSFWFLARSLPSLLSRRKFLGVPAAPARFIQKPTVTHTITPQTKANTQTLVNRPLWFVEFAPYVQPKVVSVFLSTDNEL
jgi:hypothetical protein